MKCDRCGDDVPAVRALRNVYYSDGDVSRLVSKMHVCPDCLNEMRDDDNWDV